MSMATELPPLKKKDLDEIRDLLSNGSPEWLILFAAARHHGTVTNAEVKEEIGDDPTWSMSYARISQAKKRLTDKGLFRSIPTYRGVSHNFELGMEDEYARLFHAALAIIKRRNENALYKAGNEVTREKARRGK
jgi:hypothetical protein